MTMTNQHTPVLYLETIQSMQPRDGGSYVDCTVGAGEHAAGLLDAAGPHARLLGIDADPDDLAIARERLAGYGGQVVLVNGNFRQLAQLAEDSGFTSVDGVLFDLGMSSIQLDRSLRGFSFQRDAPLDMRFDPRQPTTAADIVNSAGEAELRRMLYEFGDERYAPRVARAIVKRRETRKIETTKELSDVIVGVLGPRRDGINSATKTFQALRIAVNQELESLREALPQALQILGRGGRMAVIAFHSLEDRIVKEFTRYEASTCICPPGLPVCVCGKQATLRLINRKPITAGSAELALNPRARSAKLRVIEKII
jgi:16S rRNA (cytosine1402-N4)-methyltransferase